MSQIKKLQSGGTPKYGVLRIGNTVYDTPEAIDAFEGFLRAGDKSYAPITGKWMDYIRKGHDVSINPIDNTIEISGVSADDYSDLYGATKRQRRILESGKPTFGGNNFSTKFRDAVYYASGFSGPTKSTENKSGKTKVSNGKIKIDYDTIDGVQKYSNNPSNKLIAPQIDAYLAYLGDEKWGETNEWENELGDNDRILKAWYNGFEGDKGSAAKAAIDAALAEVRSKPWNEVSEASKELLEYFNIVGPDGSKSTSQSVPTSYIDENGQVKKNSQNDKGQWGTYRGTGENGTIKDALYTTYDAGELPYLINADRLGLFEGLDDSYLNSVLYGGRFYRPDEVSQNVQLQRIMDEVTRINNNATNAADLYNTLRGKINYTDYGDSVGNYLNYDSSQHYISNKAIRDYLKNVPYAALFDATPAYGVNGERIYGIYDFGRNGGTYGFRSPYYLVVGADGQLHLNANNNSEWSESDIRDAFDFLNRDYGDASGLIYNREVINGKSYGRIEITDRVNGGSYHFVVDDEGNVYHVTNKGKLELVDSELANRVLKGEQIVPADIDDSKRRVKRSEKYNPNWRPPVNRKEGGKIRELPLKLQSGSNLLTKTSTVGELTPIDDRMSDASTFSAYKWDELSDADKNDVRAVGLDLLGAILALSPDPYTSAAGLASGLGATSLMTTADVQRGDFRLGRTALSAGMDVLGALPIIGTTAKFAKIGKALTKSQKLLKVLSGLFIGAGFANAVPTLNKLVKEGPKSLTTDDLYALSGAVQASLGVGVRAKQRAGDAKLAEMISKTEAKTKVTTEAPKVKEVEVKLKPEEVTEITEAKEKAGETLRKKIEATKGVDKEKLGTDKELLKKFGFEVGENGEIKISEGATHTAKVTGKETTVAKAADTVKKVLPGKDKYSKYGFISDLWNGAAKRRAYIDEAMGTPEVRSEIDAALANMKPNEGRSVKRAYGRSQFRTAMKNNMSVEDVEKTIGTEGRGKYYSWVPTKETALVPVENSSAPNVTTKENKIQIPAGKSDERTVISKDVEIPMKRAEQLPSGEKVALPSDTKEAAIMIRPETGLTKTGKSYKQASMEKRASNLRRLQKSMNPLKTLTDLEKQNSDKLFTNQEEFNAVLQEILRKNASTRGNNTKSGETYMRDVVSKLRSLRDSGRLYKNGGIIKGQIGIPDLKNPYWKNIISIGTQVPKGPTIPTAPAEVNSPNDPIKEHQQELLRKVVDEHTSKMGYNYRNWDGSNYLIQPALSAFRYFSQKWGRNKMYDEQKAALNAGRVNRASISIPTVPTYSTAHQHLESQLQQQLMNGIKPVSSDLTAYYVTKLQQQSGLNKALQELTAQKSSYEQQANVQNQQLKSQEALQNNEIAFENAKMRASINSGLHQLEAAKLGEEQASRDNLLYEIQQKLYQDQQLLNQVSTAKINQKNTQTYQALLQNEFADEWATWQTVDQTKYADFEDYVRQINPTKYNQKRELLEQRKQELDNDLIINSTKGKMNYPWLYNKSGGYHGPAGYLKGGRINGKTRYTLEPDERVWIDNNKAAHAKSAKLNDAAIKLLLRALK